MKIFTILLLLLVLSLNSLYAASSQDDVKVAIIGKLSKFIKWNTNSNNQNFIITVLGDDTFKELLDKKYNGLQINSKNVVVTQLQSIDKLKEADILYIGDIAHEEQYKFIQHSKNNSILSISQEKGFAQRGGVIQLYFVSQKLKLKINHQSSLESNLKINAALLSIATIVKSEPQ